MKNDSRLNDHNRCVYSEITTSYIYMLMECGNLDLNTWLRNRKTVNPLERKFYWKNMLEAVDTIHKHGPPLFLPLTAAPSVSGLSAQMNFISNKSDCPKCPPCVLVQGSSTVT